MKICYPLEIELESGSVKEIDRLAIFTRPILHVVDKDEQYLRNLFYLEGFNSNFPEIYKKGQIGKGLRKRLTNNLDIHIRLLNFNDSTSVDSEIEYSIDTVRHVLNSDKWVPDITTVSNIFMKNKIYSSLYYISGNEGYKIKRILKSHVIEFSDNGGIKWKDIAVITAVSSGIAAILLGLVFKKHK